MTPSLWGEAHWQRQLALPLELVEVLVAKHFLLSALTLRRSEGWCQHQ